MPIPDLSNKPGPGRPGWGPIGSYDFQLEVTGAVTVKANAAAAGTFRISWPNGTTNTYSGNNASIAAPDATAGIVSINNEELDTTYADEFAVVSGQTNVSKVISWGNNAWSNMNNAFSGCTSLSDISTTSFISYVKSSAAQGDMVTMFNGCTSLLEADIRNWNLTAGAKWYGGCPFKGLVNLQKLDMTGLNVKLVSRADNAFTGIGTAVTDGCEFLLSGFNMSTSTAVTTPYFFDSSRIKPTSDLSNWVFNPNGFDGTGMFRNAQLTGTNSILNCSGWSTYSGTVAPNFQGFNSGAGDTGAKLNLSNLNLSNVNSFNIYGGCFQSTDLSGIIGLSTWGATAGNVNMYRAFYYSRYFKFDNSDNFSSTFIESLTPTDFTQAFDRVGNLLAYDPANNVPSDYGDAPNITNIDLSGVTTLSAAFTYSKFKNVPDLASATFNSSGVSFYQLFLGARFSDANSHFDLSNTTVKLTGNCRQMTQSTWLSNVTFGNNVDFSTVTDMHRAHYYMDSSATGDNTQPVTITYPTYESGLSWAALTNIGNDWFTGTVGPTTGPLTTCQVDNLIRSFYNTALNSGLSINFGTSQITESPSVISTMVDQLENIGGWNITPNTLDGTLPFAYASYAVDPTGITTISPTTTPPAGSVFTATNSLSINSSTGVITINSFRGGSTIKCTYPDGCYNEVVMLIQVPFVMRIVIPSSGSTTPFTFKPQMSAGECFIDWGDTTETLTGNTTHNYPAVGSDTTYDIKVFDSPSGSKFTGMSGTFVLNESAAIDKSIMKWGEIEWQNNSWFAAPSHNQNKLRISAPNGAAHKPNLSQVTSLQNMFGVGSKGPNQVFEDVNNNLADWDVSTITNMQQMFNVSGAPVNRPSDGQPNTLQISNWDVSNVTNFSSFGYGALLTANGVYVNYLGFDITNWNTSAATNMAGMFYARGTLTGVENLNTSNVTDMNNMFSGRPVTGIDFKTKLVNGTVRWSVKKVANFSNMFRGYSGSGGSGGGITNSTFPTNWWISGDGQDVNMSAMFGNNRYSPGRFQLLTDNDAFATKTIASGSSPYGSSYTAWDMSNTTDLSSFGFSGGDQFSGKNYNINTWQISNKCTTLSYMFSTYRNAPGLYDSLDQDLGHWDVSNVTAINQWMMNFYPGRTGSINFSTANYDSLLDITDGWGQDAGSVQSGVTLEMGTSQYNPGITVEGTTNNTGTATTIYDSTKNFTNEGNAGNIAVGDILYNKDTNQYSKVLSFGTYTVVTDQSIWGSSGINYRVENSNAARGKIALISAGWFINDGGAYIPPVTPLQLQFTVVSNTQTQIDIPYVQGTSFTVDWGDGLTETSTGSNNRTLSHTYNDGNNNNVANPTVSINAQGDLNPLTGFSFGQSGGGSKALLIDIPAWGNTPFTYVQSLLSGCNNLNTLSATDAPIITASNFFSMFGSTGTLGNADLTSWDVSSATYTGYMFSGSLFNGNISNWDVSNVTNMSYMFNSAAFSGNISSWDVRNVTDAGRQFIGMSGNPDITGWFYESLTTAYFWAWSASNFNPGPFKIGATATNQNWKYMHNGTSWSTNNWTDFLVLNANAANARNPKTPTSALLAPGTNGKTFDTTRTYNTGFPNGGRAFSFLTADVTISGGSSAINGVYAYNYTTQKWVKDGDSEKTIEWNAEESVWEVLSAGVSQHVGSGGTQGNGPESSTSWTGGITVVDSSMGWSISNSLIT